MPFRDKTCLITGGASGIGLACAAYFIAKGARVAVLDKQAPPEDLQKKANGRMLHWAVDLTDEAAHGAVFDQVIRQYKQLDIAINNAGIDGEQQPFPDSTTDNWRNVLSINLDAVYWGMRWQLKHMLANQTGAIVNVASIVGKYGFPNLAAYSASKAAVLQLTKAAAVEAAPARVRVNSVSPSVVQTPLLEHFIQTSADPEATRQWFEAFNPYPGIVTVEAVADAVGFLCSPSAGFITGVDLPIDGGYTAK